MNSRRKGKVGEREFASLLRENGYSARRGQQFSGSPDSPDVICDALAWLHVEVKRVQNLNLTDACVQAEGDCGGKPWIVAHRRNHAPWLITMRAEFFFDLIREYEPVAAPHASSGDAEDLTAKDAKADEPQMNTDEHRFGKASGESPDAARESVAVPLASEGRGGAEVLTANGANHAKGIGALGTAGRTGDGAKGAGISTPHPNPLPDRGGEGGGAQGTASPADKDFPA